MNIYLVGLRPAGHGWMAAPSPILVDIFFWYSISSHLGHAMTLKFCCKLSIQFQTFCILKVGEHCVAFAEPDSCLEKELLKGLQKIVKRLKYSLGFSNPPQLFFILSSFWEFPQSFCGTFTELLNSSCECWGEVLDGMDVPSREYLALNIGLDTILRSVEDILILKVKFPSFCLNSEKLEMAMHSNWNIRCAKYVRALDDYVLRTKMALIASQGITVSVFTHSNCGGWRNHITIYCHWGSWISIIQIRMYITRWPTFIFLLHCLHLVIYYNMWILTHVLKSTFKK